MKTRLASLWLYASFSMVMNLAGKAGQLETESRLAASAGGWGKRRPGPPLGADPERSGVGGSVVFLQDLGAELDATFVPTLIENVPELEPILAEHLADNREILLHVFVALVRDRAIASFDSGDRKLSDRIVSVFEKGLREGNEDVENAVSVSFVEDTPLWDEERAAFIASWASARAQQCRFRRVEIDPVGGTGHHL